MVTRLVAQGKVVARELLSPQMGIAYWPLLGWVATKWLVEARTGGVRLLGKGGSVPDSLVIKQQKQVFHLSVSNKLSKPS